MFVFQNQINTQPILNTAVRLIHWLSTQSKWERRNCRFLPTRMKGLGISDDVVTRLLGRNWKSHMCWGYRFKNNPYRFRNKDSNYRTGNWNKSYGIWQGKSGKSDNRVWQASQEGIPLVDSNGDMLAIVHGLEYRDIVNGYPIPESNSNLESSGIVPKGFRGYRHVSKNPNRRDYEKEREIEIVNRLDNQSPILWIDREPEFVGMISERIDMPTFEIGSRYNTAIFNSFGISYIDISGSWIKPREIGKEERDRLLDFGIRIL